MAMNWPLDTDRFAIVTVSRSMAFRKALFFVECFISSCSNLIFIFHGGRWIIRWWFRRWWWWWCRRWWREMFHYINWILCSCIECYLKVWIRVKNWNGRFEQWCRPLATTINLMMVLDIWIWKIVRMSIVIHASNTIDISTTADFHLLALDLFNCCIRNWCSKENSNKVWRDPFRHGAGDCAVDRLVKTCNYAIRSGWRSKKRRM